DRLHDPGTAAATARVADAAGAAKPIVKYDTEIRVGTAGWTDKTLTTAGGFYPTDAKTPEARLRHHAARFSPLEADMGFYAVPDPAITERWVERTPDGFVFNMKAHALMTGHATDVARLPKSIRDEIPQELGSRVYAKDLPPELRDEVWRQFRRAA